jgi:PKD repeat protein
MLSTSFVMLSPAVAHASTARAGFYWNDGALPYDSSLTYTYDVAVHPEGAFSDSADHGFAYVTAQLKHVFWHDSQNAAVPYGIETVIAYFGDNSGAKEYWLADLADPNRFSSVYVAPDCDSPHGFLGPHWKLSTLQGEGYMNIRPDATGQQQRWLRVRKQSVLISSQAGQSIWENREYLYDFATGTWDLKGSNRMTLSGDAAQVRDYTAARGGGIWAGILETDGNSAPPMKKMGYANRSLDVTDHGTTRHLVPGSAEEHWNGLDSANYDLLYKSSGDDAEWDIGVKGLHDVSAQLANGDDIQHVSVDGMPAASAPYAAQRAVSLGKLADTDTVTFDDYNASGGFAWGFDLTTDGAHVFHDWQGQVGVIGALGNDQTHPDQTVRRVTLNVAGRVVSGMTAVLPTANFSFAPPHPVAGHAVSFDGSPSADADGDRLTYAWDFGDGSSASDARPVHTFASQGTYNVTLTVDDGHGAQATSSRSVIVGPDAPVASFSFAPREPVAGHRVSFDGGASSDADGDQLTYVWAFGDGSTATGSVPTHTFALRGVYNVTLAVDDGHGGSSEFLRTVVVGPNRCIPAKAQLAAAKRAYRHARDRYRRHRTSANARRLRRARTRLTNAQNRADAICAREAG